jgi:hypothetical protein
MAPNTKPTVSNTSKTSKSKKSLTEQLATKGFTTDEHDVDSVVVLNDKEYIVKLDGDKKIFEEVIEEETELTIETYDDNDDAEESDSSVEIPVVKTKKEKTPRKPKKKVVTSGDEAEAEAVAEEVAKPKKEKAPRKSKKTVVVTSGDEAEVEAEEEVKPKKAKAPRKSKKVDEVDEDGKKKRKRRDPNTPKRHRSPTPYNQFISEKMGELKPKFEAEYEEAVSEAIKNAIEAGASPDSEEAVAAEKSVPKINGRNLFKLAVEMWRNFPPAEKTIYEAKFRTEHPKIVESTA